MIKVTDTISYGKKIMKYTLKLLILFSIASVSCVGNLQKEANREIIILDSSTNEAIEGLPLVYHEFRYPYFIVTSVHISKEYISEKGGKVQVPKDTYLQPSIESNYEVDYTKTKNFIEENIIYLKKIKP
jgi:hypothetical protein